VINGSGGRGLFAVLRRQPHVRIERDMYERICHAIVEGATGAVAT
jgi:hypothetical protein